MNRVALLPIIAAMLAAAPLSAALAQNGERLAPPLSRYDDRYADDTFSWRGVPDGERIPVERASFDRDGYRLIDDRGQAILVPFEGDNLYTMRFGRTSGAMYFVNDGGVPTLYISSSDYLENRTVSGARWYPFPRNYEYTRPVYLGLAPTWNDYCSMGWYPGMVYLRRLVRLPPVELRHHVPAYAPASISPSASHSWSRWDDFCGYSRYTPYQRVDHRGQPAQLPRPRRSSIRGGYSRDRA